MRFSIRNPEKLHLQLCLVSSNIQEAMDVLSLRGPTVAGAAQPTSLRRGAALAVQPPVPHARGSGISGTKAALGVLGCALFARREQALSRRRGHIGRAASAEVEEAPKRLRRRRRVPKSKPQTEITSDMLTLNTCNCDLILDTVVEFEDLLAPNEARALLDAARDTPDGFQQKLRSLSAGSRPLACEAVLGILALNQDVHASLIDLFLLVVTDAVTIVEGKEAIQRVRKCEALPAGENSSEGAEAAATVTQLLEEHFYFSHSSGFCRKSGKIFGALLACITKERETSPSLLHADPRYVWNLSLCEPLLGQGVTERWFTPVAWPK
eukprot:s2203_g5.t1